MRVEGVAARLVVVAVMGVLTVSFAFLGRWQLQRAAESRARHESFASTATQPALMQPPDDAVLDTLRYRELQVRGGYEPRLQFLLDNMVHEGDVGYQVLTPFRVDGSDRWLLVNRGWRKADPDRSVLPDVRVDTAARELTGRVDSLPQPGLVLGASPSARAEQGLIVVSYPSAADLAVYLGHATFGYQVLLDAMEPDGYQRDWQVASMLPERNLAYAGQWFLFAIGAGGVALVTAARLVRARPRVA